MISRWLLHSWAWIDLISSSLFEPLWHVELTFYNSTRTNKYKSAHVQKDWTIHNSHQKHVNSMLTPSNTHHEHTKRSFFLSQFFSLLVCFFQPLEKYQLRTTNRVYTYIYRYYMQIYMYIDIHPHPFNQTLQPTNPFNQPTSKLEIIQPVHPSRLGMGRLVKDINNAVAVAVCLVPQRWPGTQRKAVQETSWA